MLLVRKSGIVARTMMRSGFESSLKEAETVNSRKGLTIRAMLVGLGILSGFSFVFAQATTNLTFWIFDNPPMVTETQKLIPEYEASHPNVKINLQILPNAQYSTKYTVALGTHTGPDAFLVSDRSIPTLAAKGALAPVVPSSFGFDSLSAMENDWLKGSLTGLEENGKLYGIPMEFDTFDLFVNTKLFKEAGLNPQTDAPKTWTQLEQVAQKLTIRKNGRMTQAGFAFPLFSGGWEALIIDPMVRQLGGTLVQGSTATLDSPAVHQVFQTWSDIYNKYKTTEVGFGSSTPTLPIQSFVDGQVAMLISGPWATPMITKGTAAYGNFEVVPLPQYNLSHPVNVLYSWNWAVNNDSTQQAAAWAFINFLSNHQQEWLTSSGYIQPRTGWLNSTVAQNFPYMNMWVKTMQYGQYTFRSTDYAQITDILGRAVDGILKQGKSVDSVLSQAQSEATKVLQNP